MKKTLIITLFATLAVVSLNAQVFNLSDRLITPGIGFGSTLYTGSGYNTTIPPISISYEQGFKDEIGPGTIGIGGYLGMTGSQWETSFLGTTYGYKYTSIIVGARGYYHMQLIDNFDTYGGLMIGYNIVSAKQTGDWSGITGLGATSSGISYSLFLGARYYFNDNLGAMAELGYGISYLTLGIAYKL
ncbi:MAG: hypothetical protein GXO79_05720 [Chlorobi bacterium]|nr:hypothetical protein [Chlorobiota bacterium]